MPYLTLEVTEELLKELETGAKEHLVTTSHYATCLLSNLFRKKENPAWLSAVPPVLRNLADSIERIIVQDG